jgi:acid phosphatase class B
MKDLKAKLLAVGPAKIEGTGTVSGKQVPIIYFGTKKINEKYDIVDEIKKIHGGTATIFAKSGDEYIRISTNVMKDAESRAIGTLLARNQAYDAIKKGGSFYGQVDILGRKYETGYEPIKNGKGDVIGIYYVGYPLK